MLSVYDLPSEVNSLTEQDINDVCNDLPENAVLRECKKTNLENLFNKFKDRTDFCLVSIQNESNKLNIKSEPNGANFYSILKSETEIDSLSNIWVKSNSPAVFVVDIKNNIATNPHL